MRWRNDPGRWGPALVLLHWISALAVFGLFALGLWMTGLGYYDSWYHKGPDLHRSLGVLLFLLTLTRLAWRLFDADPAPLAGHRPWDRRSAQWVHGALYLLLILVMVSGYFISTAEGEGVAVFDWFTLPATLSGLDRQADIAGAFHLLAAWLLIGLAALHGAAALKHHFLDRDRTLLRMLGL